MSNYGLVRVKREPHTGRIVQAQLRGINAETNKWVGEAFIENAPDVARRIAAGDRVMGIFGPDAERPFTRHGSDFCVRSFDDDFLGIELEEESEGRTVNDLAKLD